MFCRTFSSLAGARSLTLGLALSGSVAVALALVSSSGLRGQTVGSERSGALVPGDTVVVTPSGRYPAGLIHKFLLGSNHRELWETPMKVQVLDLATFAGGLTPTRLGGGLQTRSLRFTGADGRVYAFRSLDKDASRTLDPELRRSVAARVLQDQISALLPVSALVVDPLLEAVGVLHARPVLRVMPDDPVLGEFRDEFRGLVGLVEERPDEGPDGTPGFAGSTRVTASDRFLELLEGNPRHQVDGPVYLKARLMDFFVGDWDRHPDQWRWAEFETEGGSRWEPIPRDRDWALSSLGGVLVDAVGYLQPHYQGFKYDYPTAFRASWSGRALDRHLLSGLSRTEFRDVAMDLQSRLTDTVLRESVSRLPESYQAQIGSELYEALANRRDEMPSMADEFYLLLAERVDVFATDEEDIATATRAGDGSLALSIRGRDESDHYFVRTFLPSETKEVRVFMRGDEDDAIVEGDGGSAIIVRFVGGGSDDRFIDRTDGSGVHFYDDRGDNEFDVSSGTSVDESDYDEPEDPGSATHQARPRDWGSRAVPVPYAFYDSDLGFVLGAGFVRWGYGFRHFPHRTRVSGSLGFSTGSGRPRAEFNTSFPFAGPRVRGRLSGHWTGAEVQRFFGFGNGTTLDSTRAYYEAGHEEAQVDLRVEFSVSEDLEFGAGPRVRFFEPFEGTGRLIDQADLYGRGSETFVEVGVAGGFIWDTRDFPLNPTEGAHLEAEARWFPILLDATSAFAGVRGTASFFQSLQTWWDPVLALRLGGEKLFGVYPYQEAAYLGGGTDLRAFRNERFAGDAAVFANAELRLALGEFFFQVPADFGVFGLVDTGRVFHELDTTDRLHTSMGGGVWFAFAGRGNAISIGYARSAEDSGFYAGAGFHF